MVSFSKTTLTAFVASASLCPSSAFAPAVSSHVKSVESPLRMVATTPADLGIASNSVGSPELKESSTGAMIDLEGIALSVRILILHTIVSELSFN